MKRFISGLTLLLLVATAAAQTRIPSGTTDQVVYFVAVDSTDFTTRRTGLTGFTVYRSRNGGTATAMTTPTVSEVDATNMPGVYSLLLDEDMTIGAGNDSEEMIFHITVATMAPVDRTIELYRRAVTAGETLTVSSGAATVGTNNDKTGYSLSSTQTFDLIGDITGNLSGSVGSVTGAVGSVTGAVGSLGAGAITEASFSTSAGSFAPLGIPRQGTAQAYTAGDPSVTLDASAPFADGDLQGGIILVCGSTNGYCQPESISNYTASTKKVTLNAAFNTAPTGTLTYWIFGVPPSPVIEPNGSITESCIQAVALAYMAGTLTTSGGVATYKDPSGTSTRLSGTYSSGGNRSSITITCP